MLGALPETTAFPGRQAELLFAPLEALPFPVDACLCVRWIPNDTALGARAPPDRRRRPRLREESHGDHGPTAQTSRPARVARELEEELTTP